MVPKQLDAPGVEDSGALHSFKCHIQQQRQWQGVSREYSRVRISQAHSITAISEEEERSMMVSPSPDGSTTAPHSVAHKLDHFAHNRVAHLLGTALPTRATWAREKNSRCDESKTEDISMNDIQAQQDQGHGNYGIDGINDRRQVSVGGPKRPWRRFAQGWLV